MIGGGIVKNGKANVLEISNRASVQKLNEQDVTGITARIDNHESGLNNNAHQINNISGLTDALNNKANNSDLELKADAFVGFTGSISVVTGVDFVNSTVLTSDINIVNGIITEVI